MPLDSPWALEIDAAHRLPGFEQFATFHPTFLYEAAWNLFVVGVLLWADKRFMLGRGKVFALYIALYGFGRFFTEAIRLDYSYDTFGPIRFNQFVAMLICIGGVLLLAWLVKFRPGREEVIEFRTDETGKDEDALSDTAQLQGELEISGQALNGGGGRDDVVDFVTLMTEPGRAEATQTDGF
jgi:hypothetical protein